jgi:hypothetical protein
MFVLNIPSFYVKCLLANTLAFRDQEYTPRTVFQASFC